MKTCEHCNQEAKWKQKDGWSVLACEGWFMGTCIGPPLGVMPPSVKNTREMGESVFDDVKFYEWMNKRIRELWPLEPPA